MRYRSCCCCAACCTYPICPVQVVARCQQDTRSWFFSVYISNPLPLRTTFDTIRVPGTFFLLVFCCLVNWMNLPHPDWNKRPHFFIRFLSRYRPLSCFRVHRLEPSNPCLCHDRVSHVEIRQQRISFTTAVSRNRSSSLHPIPLIKYHGILFYSSLLFLALQYW